MRRVLLIAILLVVPFFLTGCSLIPSRQKSATPSPSGAGSVSGGNGGATNLATVNYMTVDPSTVTESIAANQQQAANKVKAWKEDAVLHHISVTLPANLEVGQATEVYTYGSASDAYNWWTLNISGKTGKSVRAIIPKEDFLGTELKPIPMQFWKINYVEALQLAEANGGADYRANHPGSTIVLSLAVGEPRQYLWWTVEYQAGDQSFKILVNPATKEVMNESGIPIVEVTPSP